MYPRFCAVSALTAAHLGLAFLGLVAPAAVLAAPAPGFQALPGHVPAAALASAQKVSALSPAQPVSVALTLPLHHQAELADLLRGLSDPKDPRFGQFLTPEEFAARFSPTPAEYARVTAYAKSVGLTVTGTHPNRTLLDVSGSASAVERAFGLRLSLYQSAVDGRMFFAPDADPQVPASLGGLVSGVVGLSNASVWCPHSVQSSVPLDLTLDPYAAPAQVGSGPGGGLTPSDIKTAYNLSSAPQNGSGQTLGLFELDGYTPSDVTAYETRYGLPNVPLQNVAVDGGVGALGNGAGEVTLDIELQLALAPNAAKIIVYEAPNSDAGVVDTYNRIATDDLATEISTSWGEAENYPSPSTRNSENAAFRQMAAQGQSIFAASGDSGAYDDPYNRSTLSVDDPASQPYMVGVGGTSLATNGAGGAYQSETTWNNGSGNGAGGGGISTIWPIPSYQSGRVGSAASRGSATNRNVPDISLDANQYTGYSIYFGGGFTIFGGTSCASPLWAAFTALVNQKRAAAGAAPLGFANPAIYGLATSSSYANDFHDIADGSTNLYYPAVTGYDNATGWGTFNGANLLTDLSNFGAAPAAPAAPTGLSATPSDAQVALRWTGSVGASSYNVYRSTTSGTETLLTSGLTTPSYTDTGLTNGTTYFYQVAAVNSAGTSAKSGEVSAVPQAVPVSQINAGGGAAGSFIADADASGGSTYSVGTPISTAGVTSPAPQAVYQSERFGNFGYTLPNLMPGASYTLRLHFAEIYWNAAGQRLFNVSVNGSSALTNFDIFQAAGGANKAVVETIPVTADANGKVTVTFTTVRDNAKISGLELLTSSASAAPAAPTGLTAVPGNTQVSLSWTGSVGASSYNVYRSMTSGTETLLTSGLTTPSYTDTGLTNGTTYFYRVAAVGTGGTSFLSGETSATPVGQAISQIDAGGGAATPFAADTSFSGGQTYATAAAVSTAGVTSPAPQAIYQSERFGNFGYTLPDLTPGASYTLRLHFAEIYWNAAGQRLFNVSVNGSSALTNFDIFQAAGGANKAVVETIPVTADSSGKVTVAFTTVRDNAKISGLELLH